MNVDTIICGDAAEALEEMEAGYVDAIITDPPYDSHVNVNELHRICKGNVVSFCSPENQFFRPDEFAWWIKTPSTKNYVRHLGRFVEMILILRGETFNALHWSQMTGVYDDRLVYPPVHPNEKPLALMERLIRIYTNPGDIVLDPFCGSGTTLVAAKELGRHWIGIDISPAYCELSRKRIAAARVPLFVE